MTFPTFDALPFNPKAWSTPAALKYGTCYTYALGDLDLITLQTQAWNPGGLSKPNYCPPDRYQCVLDCVEDGLEWTRDEVIHRPGTYPIALFCTNEPDGKNYDHHVFRMNPDGTWSDKNIGSLPSVFTESNGDPIYDLDNISLTIRRPNNTEHEYWFTGYFNVPRDLSVSRFKVMKRTLMDRLPHRQKKTMHFGSYGSERYSEVFNTLKPKRKELARKRSLSYVIPQA